MEKVLKKRNRKTERNKEIYALRQQGNTYRAIAERYQLSIIRVRQIIEVVEAANDSIHESDKGQIRTTHCSGRVTKGAGRDAGYHKAERALMYCQKTSNLEKDLYR